MQSWFLLCIREIWSYSSLCATRATKDSKILHVDNKNSTDFAERMYAKFFLCPGSFFFLQTEAVNLTLIIAVDRFYCFKQIRQSNLHRVNLFLEMKDVEMRRFWCKMEKNECRFEAQTMWLFFHKKKEKKTRARTHTHTHTNTHTHTHTHTHTKVGQGPAVLATGAGRMGYFFYIFHLSSLNVLSFGRRLNMTEILSFWLLNPNSSYQLLPRTSSLITG